MLNVISSIATPSSIYFEFDNDTSFSVPRVQDSLYVNDTTVSQDHIAAIGRWFQGDTEAVTSI